MFLTNLFFLKKGCQHEKITPDLECGYCPDCGKFIQNEWYVTRCSCCGVKLRAVVKNGKIIPQNHFCVNCGGHDYTVEKIEKINFVDINFAVLLKKENSTDASGILTYQCWQEKTLEPQKLLVQYL